MVTNMTRPRIVLKRNTEQVDCSKGCNWHDGYHADCVELNGRCVPRANAEFVAVAMKMGGTNKRERRAQIEAQIRKLKERYEEEGKLARQYGIAFEQIDKAQGGMLRSLKPENYNDINVRAFVNHVKSGLNALAVEYRNQAHQLSEPHRRKAVSLLKRIEELKREL